ncbi:MAG: molybdopterin-dependent oxidoreductase, partial [Alicyclobacillus mali]|nr:molybdopterin-dependent oxidoreductase [Alicyclobacillus mali (ex Roth et al. 2021)]
MRYLTDLHHPGMLIGGVLRSDYPHARIRHIDTSRAQQIPGVRAVLTWRDVPGLNRYGIVIQDQPVFCEDRIRYVGDVLAAVAADSRASLEQALAAIQVEYEPLPVVAQPEQALRRTSVKLHPTGNLLHRRTFSRGDVTQGFAASAVIVEAVYETPRQMHTYMETEGGMCIPEPDGSLTLYAPTQHGYGDRAQLARILGWPEERIRIV